MKYVSCPVCGHKLLEGETNSYVKVKCTKCKTVSEVKITDKGVDVSPVKLNI